MIVRFRSILKFNLGAQHYFLESGAEWRINSFWKPHAFVMHYCTKNQLEVSKCSLFSWRLPHAARAPFSLAQNTMF